MSAIAAEAPGSAPSKPKQGMSQVKKLGLAVAALWLGGLIFFIAVFGFHPHKAPEVASGVFTPTSEVKLDTWFSIGPIDFNKGVLYVVLAGLITIGVLVYVARRLKQRPGRMQVAVEMFYNLTSGMARENLDDS